MLGLAHVHNMSYSGMAREVNSVAYNLQLKGDWGRRDRWLAWLKLRDRA